MMTSLVELALWYLFKPGGATKILKRIGEDI